MERPVEVMEWASRLVADAIRQPRLDAPPAGPPGLPNGTAGEFSALWIQLVVPETAAKSRRVPDKKPTAPVGRWRSAVSVSSKSFRWAVC